MRDLIGSFASIILITLVIVVVLFIYFKNKSPEEQLFTLSSENLATAGITVGGTVVAQKEVDLSFETSGRVNRVLRQAGEKAFQGETITSLDTGVISSNILKAQADIDAEIAKLNEYKNQEGNDLTEVESKKNQLVREIQNAYTVSEDAIKNKTDQFFEDPDSRFPRIFFIFDKYDLRREINDQRYEIGEVLEDWQEWVGSVTKQNYTEKTISDTKNSISKVQDYLNFVASAVNQFEANETYPQTTIDKYKADTATARTNMNNTLTDLISAQEAVQNVTSQIPYQEARVKAAQAVVQNYQAELEKYIIRAPFTGLVTKQDAKVGMSAAADQGVVTMISDSNYGLDTYVPEIYISQIKIGNKAKVILNSYGATQNFDATVTYIDPAASPRDGVASYKVELIFDQNDERIKSGMTGDVEIMTEVTSSTFWIPVNALIDQGGASYVKVKDGEGVELRKVEVGERNPEEIEILTGLIVGDQIIIGEQK